MIAIDVLFPEQHGITTSQKIPIVVMVDNDGGG
jgi:hypothetical protein